MNIKTIEKNWLSNFKKSELVVEEKFNSSLASKLFYGFDDSDEECYTFKKGFRSFENSFDYSNLDKETDKLLEYLHFIGITLKKQAVEETINREEYTQADILKKAFFIFKQLASYDDSLDINDPFHDNMGDLFFFMRIEQGDTGDKQLTVFDEIELPDLYNKYIELPKGYESDEFAMSLFNKVESSGDSFFITGKAGTGKSTFIHYLTKNTSKKVLLVAFTGIAAINIGGQTIHSFFGFPLRPLLPEDEGIPIFKRFFQKRKILENIDIIIIDEVSMLRADVLEGLDYSLRANGGNPNELFGGKQLIFVGDIFQLPPVVENNEVERELFKTVYNSEYFFDSLSYKKLNPECIEFQRVYRQKDIDFIRLLNKVRDCSISLEGIEALNERYNPHFVANSEEFTIMLTSNNYLSKIENRKRIDSLPYKIFFYKAIITGEFKEDRYPTEPILELRRNSQVMFVKNDLMKNGRRWVNGTIAKVEFLNEKVIEIKLKNGSTHKIEKETWENRKYQWDKKKGKITSKIIGTFEQFPLKLAWAITIHKSQGLTFDNTIIDLGSGAFANGQLYTALSRCRTFQGITLKRKIKKNDIIEDERLTRFYNEKINPKKIYKSNITWDFLLKNQKLLITLISIHYPFSEEQLLKYKDILIFGSTDNSHEDYSIPQVMYAEYGLTFNENIFWSEKVRKAYWQEPYIIHGFDSEDVWYKIDFDALPMSKAYEVEFYSNYWKSWAMTYATVREEWEDCINNDLMFIKEFEKAQNQFNSNNLEEYFRYFNEDKKFKIVKYALNINFYFSITKRVKSDLSDFSIEEFLNKINKHNYSATKISDESRLEFEFKSSDFLKYENGVQVSDLHGVNSGRLLKVQPNGSENFTVTLFNLDGTHFDWKYNVQVTPKQMKIVESTRHKIVLLGYGNHRSGTPFSNYGLTIKFASNGKDVEKCILHLHNKNIDYEYLP